MRFDTDDKLFEFVRTFEYYMPNAYVPTDAKKEKRLNLMKREYDKVLNLRLLDTVAKDIYDIQFVARSIVLEILNSHVLAGTELGLGHLVREYRDLKTVIIELNNQYKRLNQFPELKEKIPTIKANDIETMLYSDVTAIVDEIGLDWDIGEVLKK